MDIIKSIEHEQLKSKIPVLNVGDTVRVHVRIKEGSRERIQIFEGTIMKKQGGGLNETFTVRRLSYGIGVEKTFLIHSPSVEEVEVIRVGKARRAKLFYLRDRIGKSAKTKEKIGVRIENKEIILKEEAEEVSEFEAVPEEKLAEMKEEIKEKADEVKEEISEKIEKLKTKTDEKEKEKLEEEINTLKEQFEEAKEDLAEINEVQEEHEEEKAEDKKD